MKVVSDFDGVLTDISEEAARVFQLFSRGLSELAFISPDTLPQLIKKFETRMADAPFDHGWRWEKKITAFAGEDGFIKVNAMAAAFDEAAAAGDSILAKGKMFLDHAGLTRYTELAQRSYVEMTQETAAGKHRPIDPSGVKAIAGWLSGGAEVVVVSNSATERIEQLLGKAGLDPKRIRVRGQARKYQLGDTPRYLSLDTCRIDTDRPLYEKILMEEKPDHVLGDVFSLDLSLPLYLRRQSAPGLGGTRVWLRKREYTPSWAQRLFAYQQPWIKENEGGTFERFDDLVTTHIR